MPVIGLSLGTSGRRAIRRTSVIALVAVIAAVLVFAGFSNERFAQAIANTVQHGVKTVSDLLAQRSPGHRPKGELASLKHKRKPVLHARARPKVRRGVPIIPEIAEMPQFPVTPPEIAPPLFTLAGLPPDILPPIVITAPGGPPILPPIPLPGSGPTFIPPPIITEVVPPPPPPPPPSGVPEPATWGMMLVGFALMGGVLRRRSGSRSKLYFG